jgi:NTE family protein
MLKQSYKDKPFSLVLSGGGALGIAHLGVLHDLEGQKLVPSEIIGTSMGGIIGACIAIGLSEVKIYEEIKAFSSVSKWVKFSLQGNAIIDTNKIENIFIKIFANKKMKDTLIPLKLIATQLSNGDKKVFSLDDDILIKDALLATMAIPGIFDEHIIAEEHYVDGFLCENLGVNEASFEQILAVDVLGTNAYDTNLPDNFFKTANVLEMFEKSMRLLILNQTRTHLENLNKEVILIEPNTKDFNTFYFHKHEELRALGLGLLHNFNIKGTT